MPGDGDLTWRADVTSDSGDEHQCETTAMGTDQTIAQSDLPQAGQSIERTVIIASACAAGTYSLDGSASADGEVVAEASKSFTLGLSWLPAD